MAIVVRKIENDDDISYARVTEGDMAIIIQIDRASSEGADKVFVAALDEMLKQGCKLVHIAGQSAIFIKKRSK